MSLDYIWLQVKATIHPDSGVRSKAYCCGCDRHSSRGRRLVPWCRHVPLVRHRHARATRQAGSLPSPLVCRVQHQNNTAWSPVSAKYILGTPLAMHCTHVWVASGRATRWSNRAVVGRRRSRRFFAAEPVSPHQPLILALFLSHLEATSHKADIYTCQLPAHLQIQQTQQSSSKPLGSRAVHSNPSLLTRPTIAESSYAMNRLIKC